MNCRDSLDKLVSLEILTRKPTRFSSWVVHRTNKETYYLLDERGDILANKKITDVDVVSTINDADYLFVNQNSAIRQIKKSNIIKDISVDTTLSVAGQAADAKATGDAITELKNETSELKRDIFQQWDIQQLATGYLLRQNALVTVHYLLVTILG